MKKIIEETKLVKREEYYCDVCSNRMDSTDLKFCDVCEKHLCVKCAIRSEDEFGGESPSYYCPKCWNIGDTYRDNIIGVKEGCSAAIKTLENLWKKAAMKGDNDVR